MESAGVQRKMPELQLAFENRKKSRPAALSRSAEGDGLGETSLIRRSALPATDSVAIDRRNFLKIAGGTTAAVILRSPLEVKSTRNLVPPQPRPSLSYWCSWGTHNSPPPTHLQATLVHLN